MFSLVKFRSISTAAIAAFGFSFSMVPPIRAAGAPESAARRFLQEAAAILKTPPAELTVEPGPDALATGPWKAFRAVSNSGGKRSEVLQGFAPEDPARPVVFAQNAESMRTYLGELNIGRPRKSLPVGNSSPGSPGSIPDWGTHIMTRRFRGEMKTTGIAGARASRSPPGSRMATAASPSGRCTLSWKTTCA